ncbi:hypothetical protein BX666DRAFT_1934276 [Dichotomocladium elegans]|nr:hypothetical protein BX666DRAFT_1934276 [Dichotomocladium elegans]
MSTNAEDKIVKASPSSENDENELVSVCEKLDALALEYLDKMEAYSHIRDRASEHFQQGFLHLAHAKYAMGTSKISSLSYDGRMKAQIRVCHDDKTGLISFMDGPLEESKDDEEQKIESTPVTATVRPRRRKNVAQKDVDDKENEQPGTPTQPSPETKKKTTTKNPLHWFGLFVSPSLRISQTHFVKATHELLDHVNCLKDLAQLEKQYLALAEQKKLLLKQVQDRKEFSIQSSETSVRLGAVYAQMHWHPQV